MPSYDAPAQPMQPFSRAVYFSSIYSNIPGAAAPAHANVHMCYTYNKPTNYFYKPHSDLGRVGTTSNAYQWQRKRI